jgi:hypothetical protein
MSLNMLNATPEDIAAWQPVPPTIVRDAALTDAIVREGYVKVPFLPAETVEALREVYAREHKISSEDGGMFYSLYSQDLDYRQRVNDEVGALMSPHLEAFFHSYKTVLNGFIIKVPGPNSGFLIHQDTTGLDEFQFSSLSVWIPLWDIGPDDGAMCMVPRTHKFFYPYRGISFAFPFEKIHGVVKRYLEPVYMNAGEAIIFDQRTLHASLPNRSDKNRVVVVCGLFPQEAPFQNCYQESPTAPVEVYRQADDFILKYPRFMHDCRTRPIAGEKLGEVAFQVPMWTQEQFETKTAEAGLKPLDIVGREDKLGCYPMPEPDGVVREPLAPVLKLNVEPEAMPQPEMEMAYESAASTSTNSGGWLKRIFGK